MMRILPTELAKTRVWWWKSHTRINCLKMAILDMSTSMEMKSRCKTTYNKQDTNATFDQRTHTDCRCSLSHNEVGGYNISHISKSKASLKACFTVIWTCSWWITWTWLVGTCLRAWWRNNTNTFSTSLTLGESISYRLISRGPFYYHCLTLIPAWISNYIHYRVGDKFNYPFLNFNGAMA